MKSYYERLEEMSHSDLVEECRRLDHRTYCDGEAYDQLMYDYHFVVKQSHESYALLRDIFVYADKHPEMFTHDLYSRLNKYFSNAEPF
jgi:hypothetical protein